MAPYGDEEMLQIAMALSLNEHQQQQQGPPTMPRTLPLTNTSDPSSLDVTKSTKPKRKLTPTDDLAGQKPLEYVMDCLKN